MVVSNNGPQSIGQISKYFQFGELFLSPDEYQRVSSWDIPQKELLIDTIFRNYDMPKFYLWKIDKQTIENGYPDGETKIIYKKILNTKFTENNDPNPYIFEVVDGQQRIRTILEYMGIVPPNELVHRGAWLKPFPALSSTPIAGAKTYGQLNPQQQLRYDSHQLSVVVIEQAKIDEIRDMFLRLQNGTPLNAQQKRDAMGSSIGNLAKQLAIHKYFTVSVSFENYSSEFNRVAAQIINLEMKQRIESCTSRQLDKLYRQHPSSVKIDQPTVTKIKKTLEVLFKIFPEKCNHINRSYALSLYWSIARITDNYKIADASLSKIKMNFENVNVSRAEAATRNYSQDGDETYRDLSDSMSSGTDGADAIEDRHTILTGYIFRDVDLELLPTLDEKRLFSEEEKIVLYARAGGKCQLEHNGEKCDRSIEYHDASVDHIIPHSKNGKTELSNGRIAHRLCNIARGNRTVFDFKTDCEIDKEGKA